MIINNANNNSSSSNSGDNNNLRTSIVPSQGISQWSLLSETVAQPNSHGFSDSTDHGILDSWKLHQCSF